MSNILNIPVPGSGSGGIIKELTLSSSLWSNSDPYTQIINDSDVSANSSVSISLADQNISDDMRVEFSKLKLKVSESTLEFYSANVPIVNNLKIFIIIDTI